MSLPFHPESPLPAAATPLPAKDSHNSWISFWGAGHIQNTWIPDGPVEVSKYDYTNDILGRRTNLAYTGSAFQTSMSQSFGYNDRSELTSSTRGDDDWAFGYDNIGSRVTSKHDSITTDYTANVLNQYPVASTPDVSQGMRYDGDGNLVELVRRRRYEL